MPEDPTITTAAIVTGASRGLGQALAVGLMGPHTQLITVSRSHDDILAEHAEATGCALWQARIDLSDVQAAETGARQIMARLHGSAQRYILINNAGTVDPVCRASDLSSARQISAAFSLNVFSVMLLSAAFLNATKSLNADRRILNISSGAGRNPTAGWGVYCATKAAVDRYSQVLDTEQHGVKIAALAPGVIDTRMQEHIRSRDPADFPDLNRFIKLHEQSKLPSADAVAARILRYLDSDDFGATVLDDIRNYP